MFSVHNERKMLAAVAVAIMVAASMAVLLADDAEAEGGFTVTDTNGNTFSFDGAVDHIVTVGYGATLTVAETGNVDKLVAVDKYSTLDYTKDDRLSGLKAYDLGSPFKSNYDGIEQWLLNAVESGNFDKAKDAVIFTTYSGLNNTLRQTLLDDGFVNVLFFGNIDSFADLMGCVDDIAKIAAGTGNKVSSQMKETYDRVTSSVKENGPAGEFIYLYYMKSRGIGAGTGTSLGGAIIETAGGTNIVPDMEQSALYGGCYYGGDSYYVNLLADHPDAAVFLGNFDITPEEFRAKYLGGEQSFRIYAMQKDWNNYCPEAVNCLGTINSYLSEGSAEGQDDDSGDDGIPAYAIGIALVLVVGIGAALALVIRRR